MTSMDTAPSALGEFPDLGWELNRLHQDIDDIWTRYALKPDEVIADVATIHAEAARLNELIREIERKHRRAA